jgi:hypothetical protein
VVEVLLLIRGRALTIRKEQPSQTRRFHEASHTASPLESQAKPRQPSDQLGEIWSRDAHESWAVSAL